MPLPRAMAFRLTASRPSADRNAAPSLRPRRRRHSKSKLRAALAPAATNVRDGPSTAAVAATSSEVPASTFRNRARIGCSKGVAGD